MFNILLASSYTNTLSKLASALRRHGEVEISRAESGKQALDMVSGKTYDLVVADEEFADMTGLEFVRKLLLVNPMINSAVVGRLSEEDFHEASEGLGVLMQLPLFPGDTEAEDLMRCLKKIRHLTALPNE
jgi:CheY-like chemotaxis protein